MSVHTDTELFNRFRQGNEAAFREIYHLFYSRVYYFAQRYVSEADAEDVAAETFFKIWTRRKEFEDISHLSSSMFVFTRNHCLSLISRLQMQEKRKQELLLLMESEQQDFTLEPVRSELVKLLYTQLGQLPERTRNVFLLSFQEGLKPAQIAERLGVSVKTVKNQKVTAIKLLKDALSGHSLELVLLTLLHLDKFGNS
ncbi:RNA polymerase sigma factor [uncultured Chitinophaga sp.]|uniref:RNA polymerase sigma factor n=1 Tax=uncultured Chitinophaga sp. TaxID=339340 RepID=UPI00260A6219|nr:RNA polymerase sigma-70 factor [uncultured Chitinophaga sp.]